MAGPDESKLLNVASSISDGTPIDWATVDEPRQPAADTEQGAEEAGQQPDEENPHLRIVRAWSS